MSAPNGLLSREDFKKYVFERDNHKCVICGAPAADPHHILERRLFLDGGYYLDNGASVCNEHHYQCETTEISVETLREKCGISNPVIPPHFDEDTVYEKWGGVVLANGMRLRGELFHEEGVQKVLKAGNMLDRYLRYYKYPRTPHLPFSASVASDDKVISDWSYLIGKRVIVSIKMDGENSSLYSDYMHARSIDGRSHPSRDWLKRFWSTFAHDIPEGWRICGENMFAQHSIRYEDLESYFYGFSVWSDHNVCLDWDETIEWFDLLGVTPVKVLYDGPFELKVLEKLAKDIDTTVSEGFVGRLAGPIRYSDFQRSFFKWVRPAHVTTESHWMHSEIIPNALKLS